MAEKDSMESSEKCVIQLECTKSSHPFETRILTITAGEKGEKLIGRCHKKNQNASQEADNLLFDSRILSQSHAVLFYQDGKLFLKDLCSLNGTYLNEEYIGPERDDRSDPTARELKSGDILRFGKLRAIRTQGDVVKPIEAKLTIKCPLNQQLDETAIWQSNYTPYEGMDLNQTPILDERFEKETVPTTIKEVFKRNSQPNEEKTFERGTETEEVESCTTSTQVLPNELLLFYIN
uniref:FHA domain-containing protein n=1 Tax=Anopheles culicifacies TaxID=139723 RepID=A0A182MVN6_9DIPT